MRCSQASRGQRQNKDMALQLAPEEPEAGPWRAELLSTVIEAITRRGPGNAISGRPVVLARVSGDHAPAQGVLPGGEGF